FLFNYFFFFQAEDGIRDRNVTGVQTCALPILRRVEDDALLVVAEHPHVVVDLMRLAVQAERAGGDGMGESRGHFATSATVRRVSPSCSEDSAATTPATSARPVTRRPSGRRACRNRSSRYGESRSGRQSPYQEDFSAPPRPTTSSSGSVISTPGRGTPTSTTRPARSRA